VGKAGLLSDLPAVWRRTAAISGLFEFRAMRDPDAPSPVPRGAARRQAGPSERGGLLGHLAVPSPSAKLRVRQPRRLPKGLDAGQATALLASFRSWRDKAIAGLMLLSGLRSAEVLALNVGDIDIPRGWALVTGKGDKERRVPVNAEVAGLIQACLLTERPDADADGTAAERLFLVAKGPNRGHPLTAEGLRIVFGYHRERSGVTAGHPHALLHLGNRTHQRKLLAAGADGHARPRVRDDEPALRTAVRCHRPPRLRTRPRPGQDDTNGPLPGGQAMLPITDITGGNTGWKDAPLIKSRLASGYCLRTAA
jgi:integrase